MKQHILSVRIPAGVVRTSVNHAARTAGLSQALRRKLHTDGFVIVNGRPADWTAPLFGGDALDLFLPPKRDIEPSPLSDGLSLSIAFEDEHFIVVDKPAGILMHPTARVRSGTLANALVARFDERGEAASFHPIGRLDRNTSGLVVIAKSAAVQHACRPAKFAMTKVYTAMVEGIFPEAPTSVRWPIARKETSIIERACRPGGKFAHTDFTRIAVIDDACSVVSCRLHTGRTHQIRVHAAQLGFPLLGDDMYGGGNERIDRQALHAARIDFVHPVTGRRISLAAGLPADMAKLYTEI